MCEGTSVLLHCVGDARFSNNLNVYRRQRIDPHNLGFAQATQLSTICVISLVNGTGKHDVRKNKNSARGVDVGTRFFTDTRERCMGTSVDSPQCGCGGDIGTGVSTEDE